MKSLNKSAFAVVVFGALFASTVKAAPAAYDQSWGDSVETTADSAKNQALYATDKAIDAQNQATQNSQDITIIEGGLMNLDTAVTNNQNDIAQLKGNAQQTFNDINDINNKNDRQDQEISQLSGGIQQNYQNIQGLTDRLNNLPTPKDGVDGQDGKDGVNGKDGATGATGATGAQGVQGLAGAAGKDGVNGKDGATGATGAAGAQGVQGLAGAAGKDGANGKDGSNGKNGLDGVTTTITKVEVDQATQKAVAGLQQQQAKQANAFKSLKDTVDSNHKQANAGISGAMAMAGLPQVQTSQRVMFSAGGATYNGESALAVGSSVNFNSHVVGKVSFSTDTASNMGASVGVGVGF